MQKIAVIATVLSGAVALAAAGVSSGAAIDAPKDIAYPGEIELLVNASDVDRHIMHVHESVSGIGADPVLFYPKWIPGIEGPEGPIDRLAGLKISADGALIPWRRDPLDVFAFRLHLRPNVKSIDVDFDYLSPTSSAVGLMEVGRDLLMLEWNNVVLYPAGYFVRRIPVKASLTLPRDWQLGSALESASVSGARTSFRRTDLETLIDSPVYAGRYVARFDLDPGASVPVHMNLFADRSEDLTVTPEQLQAHRSLVQQTYRLFGSHHFAHYEFLYSLSDEIQQAGLEHRESCEAGDDPASFTSWDANAYNRDTLPHEFAHSWNGKFRVPADHWGPNDNVPTQNSLLWVYEGQTQYWGQVLAARSGLWSRQQALDQIAFTAATEQIQSGRRWRPLQDTTNDEIINPRRPQSWKDFQRFEDYYEEGKLIWLDADTLIRQLSDGKRSLDDFARSFFGINDGSLSPVTYTFADVVRALDAVQPYDWTTFLRQRLDSIGNPAPLDGLRRGGYRLIYTETPSTLLSAHEEQLDQLTLLFSIGIEIENRKKESAGSISRVVWDSPAFRAKLIEGEQIVAVDGIAYSAQVLKDAIRAAKATDLPIELIVKSGDRFRFARLDYHEGLRYPHLEREPSEAARLDEILAPR